MNNLNSNVCTLTVDSSKTKKKFLNHNNISYNIGKQNLTKIPSEQIQIYSNMLTSKKIDNSKSSNHISNSKDKKININSKYSHNTNQLHITQISEFEDPKIGGYGQKSSKNFKNSSIDKEYKFHQISKQHIRTKTFDKNDKSTNKTNHHLNPNMIQNKINLKKNIKIKQDFLSNITKTFDKRLLYYSKKDITNSQNILVAPKEKENASKKLDNITEKMGNKKKINENIISLK